MFRLYRATRELADAAETMPYEASRVATAAESMAESFQALTVALGVCAIIVTGVVVARFLMED